MDAALHQDPGAENAALAREQDRSRHGLLRGRDDVGVLEDEVRGLASEFESHRLERLQRRGEDALGRLTAASEVDLIDVGVADQCLATGWSTGHHVDHARREAGLKKQLADAQAAPGRELRRLEHHAVARGQRGSHDLADGDDRSVPRHDHPDDAVRLVEGVVQRRHRPRPDDLSTDLVGPAGVVGEEVRREQRRARGDHGRRPVVDRRELRDRRSLASDEPGGLGQQVAAPVQRRGAPAGQRGAGRPHRGVDLTHAGHRHAAGRLPGSRVHVRELAFAAV